MGFLTSDSSDDVLPVEEIVKNLFRDNSFVIQIKHLIIIVYNMWDHMIYDKW